MNKTLLVVPCYNEAKRLDLPGFAEASHSSLQIIFVDDGSKDNTEELISGFISGKEHLHILRLRENTGKANAIRQGMQHALSHPGLSGFEWYGYWDADLSTPLWEVENMLSYRATYGDHIEGIFGSRVYRLGSTIRRSQIRHFVGRGFATIVKILLDIDTYDSQCGAKLFKRSLAEIVFSEPFLSRWIFDLEILLRAEQKNIIEYPLRRWEDIPGGQLRIAREFPGVMRDLLKIHRAYFGPGKRK